MIIIKKIKNNNFQCEISEDSYEEIGNLVNVIASEKPHLLWAILEALTVRYSNDEIVEMLNKSRIKRELEIDCLVEENINARIQK